MCIRPKGAGVYQVKGELVCIGPKGAGVYQAKMGASVFQANVVYVIPKGTKNVPDVSGQMRPI